MNVFGVFKGKRPEPKEATTSSGVPLESPAYYEVWGSLERTNTILWVALWLSSSAAFLELIIIRVQASRPPLVIRVDGSGQAQILGDPGRQPPVTEVEIKNFLTLFEKFFTELNCYTYDSDLRLAFSMMTPEFQSKAGDQLKRDGIFENAKANQAKTTLTLTEIKVVKDTPQILDCHAKGYRVIGSYKPDVAKSEVVFEDDIVLKKVARSGTAPYGVLVQDWTESLFKR